MKYELRVPTTEQYAYINAYFEGTPEEAVELHKHITNLAKGDTPTGIGVKDKVWNAFIDEFLKTGAVINGGDIYEHMSAEQKRVIGEIKKSNNRTK